jgi:hypothetical protein
MFSEKRKLNENENFTLQRSKIRNPPSFFPIPKASGFRTFGASSFSSDRIYVFLIHFFFTLFVVTQKLLKIKGIVLKSVRSSSALYHLDWAYQGWGWCVADDCILLDPGQ